jgi:hypothetical protein
MNYAHLVYGMQMASTAQAWMYRQPQEDWENFLKRGQWFSKSSRGRYEKPWCSGNAFPLYRLSQPKEIRIIGNHFSSFGHTWFHKNYTCWNKHGEEGFNELEAGCLNEGEVRHHATDHDEDLDDSGVFDENEPYYSHQMC